MSSPAQSPPYARTLPPVVKRIFDYGPYTTLRGERIESVRVGWEHYGELNAAKDNAIFAFHFLTGYSHVAGKYQESDPRPGYWDRIIGPGKIIDTDKYFVLSADSLCNVNARRPDVVCTGPASINPATGKPYGQSFPKVSFQDMLDVFVGLLDHLGIKTLHAAIGLSMGGFHAYELASSYPERVRKIIPIACAPASDAWLSAWTNTWMAPLKLDPAWRDGDYYDHEFPTAGMAGALKMVTMNGRDWNYTDGYSSTVTLGETATFGRAWADPSRDPAGAMDALFAIEADMAGGAKARAKYMDANHFHYIALASRSFRVGRQGSIKESLARIKADVMHIHSGAEDHMYPMANVNRTIAALMEVGVKLRVIQHTNTLGHSDMGAIGSPGTGDAIRRFLEEV